jgi:predicted MFS family arabinose efflux permease
VTLGVRQAERRLILLTATRWLPVGLALGLTVLLPLERGLSLSEVGGLMAIAGFVSLALELPTGGLADTIGRRPLLLVAATIAIASTVIFVLADSAAFFAVALVLQGVFRALDSGPLESWFVDTAQSADPAAPIDRGLSRAGTMLGVAIAGGALASGLLVAWHPIAEWSALVPPFLLAIAAQTVHLVLVAVLVREPKRMRMRVGGRVAPEERAGAVIAAAARLLRESSVLRWLVAVEIFWAVAMIAFETLTPVRLAEFVGGEEQAGALFGPAAAAAWALFAVGSTLAGLASRRLGVAATAIIARTLNGVFVILMGVVAGAPGLIAGFWLAYLTHGANGPMHNTLLHRQSGPKTRTLVLSVNAMVAAGTCSLALLVLLPLAEVASSGVAFVAAGAFSLLGVACYLPALRQERASRATG